ncbi:MAG TPA: histidine phosphatase family protein [Polyangiales bacterium]|nr:histidine phosphatase family protein [Polyangiales bacterium]
MSQLLLVRHGQAAAFSDDSDRLTELGERQAALLGEYFVSRTVQFDQVIVGGLRRHVQTEAQVAAAYARAGLAWPNAESAPGWNEYDAQSIMRALSEALPARDPDFKKLVDDFQRAGDGPERNRYFQRMFEVLMAHWVAGDVEAPGVESFEAFHARVSSAFDAVVQAEGSRRVVVFSSGGPIGVSIQRALRSPKPVGLELNWRVRNTSLTEFLFARNRLSLDLFNAVPHLVDERLQSFR